MVINGKSYQGKNITIVNDIVTVDGIRVDIEDKPLLHIIVEGDLQSLSVDACEKVDVKGNVSGYLKSVSGDIKCDNATDVSTISGDIEIFNLANNAKSVSGDITINTMNGGNPETKSGNININTVNGGLKF